MKTGFREPIRQLPLLPKALLKSYGANEKYDTRFRACARLLQSLWREAQDLPPGTISTKNGGKRQLGSCLKHEEANQGRNFLAPSIAEVARLEIAYQERGALIDEARLFTNLLSSMPLAFNLAGPWRLRPKLAAQTLRHLLPHLAITKVLDVWFEHSPSRLNSSFTGDRSALDIAVVYERPDGTKGFIGFEVKYTEDGRESGSSELNPAYDRLAQKSGLYKEPAHAALRAAPMQQLFREHLLCFSTLDQELYSEVSFVLISPRHNHSVERMQALYSSFLLDGEERAVPFHYLELEEVIAAYAIAGEEQYASLIFERYCDWAQIDFAVEQLISAQNEDWSVIPLRPQTRLALSGEAA